MLRRTWRQVKLLLQAQRVWRVIQEEERMGKNPLQSKTVWTNLIALVAMFVQHYTGTDYLDPQTQAALLAVVNLVLRITTREPLKLRSGT